jgi:hypothetical protein
MGSLLNRWGDALPEAQPPISRLALAAALSIGPAGASAAATPLGGECVALLNLASFVGVLFGLVLSYLAFFDCRLDGPIPGRGWAWLAIGCTYVSLFVWYARFTWSWPTAATWGLVAITLVAVFHLLVFASESPAGKYFFLAVLLGGTLLALVGPWLLQSREASRRLRAEDNLRQLGTELLRDQELRRGAPAPQPAEP